MLSRRQLIAASAGLVAAGTGFLPRARAQTVKNPVRIIVGFPAGGGTDIASRILAERLRGAYSSTLLVENKPGAGARLAAEFVKNAEPDGATIMSAPEFVITLYPSVFKSLNYDPVRDFAHIAPVYRSMLSFNVGPGVPDSVKTGINMTPLPMPLTTPTRPETSATKNSTTNDTASSFALFRCFSRPRHEM